MWKEKLWQVFLVIILGFVLTMCNRSASNNKSSNSGTLNADGTSTVSVSSLPKITLDNSSTVSVSSLKTISHSMMCMHVRYYNNIEYSGCDATDDTVFGTSESGGSGAISHDAAFAAGWRIAVSGCSSGNTSAWGKCVLFHK